MGKHLPEDDHKSLRIIDAAEALGLSVSTVSRALSGKGRVSEDTRRRVVEWTRQNAWLPNTVSRTLRYGKSGNIAVLLPSQPADESTPFFHYYLLGVCESAAAFGYDVIVMPVQENDPRAFAALLERGKVDGVMLTNRESAPFFELLQDAGIPCVVVGSRAGQVQIDHDIVGACGELTGIMLDNGLRRVAYLGGSSTALVNQFREQGFVNGFKMKGIQHDPSLVFTGMDSAVQIEQTVLKLIDRGVQGVVTGDDVICSRVMAILHWMGVGIPDEMQVASFHHSFLMDIQSPQVSCVKTDPKMLSATAARLLFDLIQGREVPLRSIAEHEIVIRGSTRKSVNSA